MSPDNLKELSVLLDTTSEYYQRPNFLSDAAVCLYASALSEYSISQIRDGLSKHIRSGKAGQFFPKAVDIISHISGAELSHDEVIAMASLKNCPFGILAMMKISDWSLSNLNSFELKPYAQECIELLPEWREKAEKGTYTDHEIRIMLKYGVNPSAPLYRGISPLPENQELISRSKKIYGQLKIDEKKQEEERQGLLARPDMSQDKIDENKKRLAGILGMLKGGEQ